jgi:hypothetical protein
MKTDGCGQALLGIGRGLELRGVPPAVRSPCPWVAICWVLVGASCALRGAAPTPVTNVVFEKKGDMVLQIERWSGQPDELAKLNEEIEGLNRESRKSRAANVGDIPLAIGLDQYSLLIRTNGGGWAGPWRFSNPAMLGFRQPEYAFRALDAFYDARSNAAVVVYTVITCVIIEYADGSSTIGNLVRPPRAIVNVSQDKGGATRVKARIEGTLAGRDLKVRIERSTGKRECWVWDGDRWRQDLSEK